MEQQQLIELITSYTEVEHRGFLGLEEDYVPYYKIREEDLERLDPALQKAYRKIDSNYLNGRLHTKEELANMLLLMKKALGMTRDDLLKHVRKSSYGGYEFYPSYIGQVRETKDDGVGLKMLIGRASNSAEEFVDMWLRAEKYRSPSRIFGTGSTEGHSRSSNLIESKESKFNLEAELDKIVGLESVKDYIRSLAAQVKIQGEREKFGLPTQKNQSFHMIFKGNPGTGKTMMARIVSKLLHELGLIKTDKLVETDRSGLVAEYVGQTAPKTINKIQEAMDGVLFIDEAYSLVEDIGGFGQEAIDTLVKAIEDYRDRLVVILAGYSEDMDKFLTANIGLKSRFSNIIDFPDYTVDELVRLSMILFSKDQYELTPDAKNKLSQIFSAAKNESHFGNGRFVRNLYEKTLLNQAKRLQSATILTKEVLITVEATDIP